jgi:pSer/pThr/pTyr-binding forkhead associated (FHA) protein
VDPGDHFCASCGAVLEAGIEYTGALSAISATGSGALRAAQAGARSDLPPGSALLIVFRGPGEGTEFPLDADASVYGVGRSPESEIFLDDVTVSRRHAQFRHGAQGWSIRDTGSLNGTYVDRKRVNDRQLSGGEEVQIGKFRFIFLVGAPMGSSESPR